MAQLRLFNVTMIYNRERTGHEVDLVMPSERVIRALNQGSSSGGESLSRIACCTMVRNTSVPRWQPGREKAGWFKLVFIQALATHSRMRTSERIQPHRCAMTGWPNTCFDSVEEVQTSADTLVMDRYNKRAAK